MSCIYFLTDLMKLIMNLWFTVLVILLYADVVCCSAWCTRITSEEHVITITEVSKCQQAYKTACNWFSFKQCTHYELVTCVKEHNQTVVQYKIVEECCPGYELDPANNVTCIKKSMKHRNYTVQYYKSEDDELLFGLSHGAYAGILCAFLFVFSVLILILVHFIKRRQRSAAAKVDVDMGNEMTEKMIPPAQA